MTDISVPRFEPVDPGLVGRCGWEVEQTRRDLEVLAWVGRFRFVEPLALGKAFGVSWQQANARVRRLERLGLLGCERQHVSQARAVFLTGKGHELLGWPRRRAPRAETHREHEAAIVSLVTEIEQAPTHADARVLTERECRRLEVADVARYSVNVGSSGKRNDRRRWPDVVVERADGRWAYEIEFAPKGRERLSKIVGGYESESPYVEVVFLVKHESVGRTISRVAGGERHIVAKALGHEPAAVTVRRWPEWQASEQAGTQAS